MAETETIDPVRARRLAAAEAGMVHLTHAEFRGLLADAEHARRLRRILDAVEQMVREVGGQVAEDYCDILFLNYTDTLAAPASSSPEPTSGEGER